MIKGHLITCLDLDAVKEFDLNRYIGLGPFYPSSNSTDRKVGARLRILWDVIADLKRIRTGDICFLHAEGLIFGPYIFSSTFRESQEMPPILRSSNLTYRNWKDHKSEFDAINMEDYGYVASINKPSECNTTGSDLMKMFLHQSLGIFNGIPPRFMYGDTKKIVKPLLYHEIGQLLSMLDFNNNWDLLPGNLYPVNSLNEISLNLSSYSGHLYSEKILEAWFTENMSAEGSQYQQIIDIIGNFNYYSNSIYTYYTNFLDIIAYNISEDYVINRCEDCNSVKRDFANEIKVIELKRDSVSNVSSVVNQIMGYLKWANTVLNENTSVVGYIVANGFNSDYKNYTQNNSNIHFVQYSLDNGALNLQEMR